MDKVFVTHSRHDAPILAHIRQLVSMAQVEPLFYEYDCTHIACAWEEIREDIRRSNALFVVLSNNLSSSHYTQNWVGWEVGVACALDKRVFVFEEVNRSFSFPIPYFTDYVPYDLNNSELRRVIVAVARGYKLEPQFASTVAGGVIGGLLGGPPGVFIGAVLGNIKGKPEQALYAELMCYHLDCKTKFRTYVWLDEFDCPACRRKLRFRRENRADGTYVVYPEPQSWELAYSDYVWFGDQGSLQLYQP